jgi:hypothetical protein
MVWHTIGTCILRTVELLTLLKQIEDCGEMQLSLELTPLRIALKICLTPRRTPTLFIPPTLQYCTLKHYIDDPEFSHIWKFVSANELSGHRQTDYKAMIVAPLYVLEDENSNGLLCLAAKNDQQMGPFVSSYSHPSGIPAVITTGNPPYSRPLLSPTFI